MAPIIEDGPEDHISPEDYYPLCPASETSKITQNHRSKTTGRGRNISTFVALIDSLSEATFAIDLHGRVIAWNRAMERLTGVPGKKIIGRGDYVYAIPFYSGRRPILIDFVNLKDGQSLPTYELTERRGDSVYAEGFVPSLYGGKGCRLSGIASPLMDAKGKRLGSIESLSEITDRQFAERTLKQDTAPEHPPAITRDNILRVIV